MYDDDAGFIFSIFLQLIPSMANGDEGMSAEKKRRQVFRLLYFASIR